MVPVLFFAAVAGAQVERVPNTTLTMPSAPPTHGYTTANALPGLIFTNPICIVSPPNETNRLFILSKNGVITVITNLAAPNWTTFMDLTPQVSSQSANSGTAGERGLLGMAFHPGFATNGFFYVVYMPTNAAAGGYFDRLARFKISAADPNRGDTNSQVVFYDQVDPDPNHNAGDIHFGADGYLYISVGDEGKEHDGFNCAQIITNSLFAGILRIDVDKRAGNLPPNPAPSNLTISSNYLIPADNPFIGITSYNGLPVNPSMVRTEFYATGLRNPWRWNFDFHTNSFGTNVLYCGDVGQDKYEEVDVIQKGDNLGWAYWEGTNVATGGSLPHTTYIASQGTKIRFPIVHYAHGSASDQGNCVIGGVVYRGSNLPQLYGQYIYADYVDGNIWSLDASDFTASPTNVTGASGPATPIIADSSLKITAFGTDPRNGDVLLCATKTTGYATAATINKIIYNTVTNGASLPPTLADTGAFTNLMSLTGPLDALKPAPGILPYSINLPFWSDTAIKSRWFSVPNTNLTIGFSPNSNWNFPAGTVWIKNFNLELTNGVPGSQIRLETRLLVKNDSGVYGVTYRWGGSKTNATMVSEGGLNESFVINDGGSIRTQVWHYPSQQECQTCHTPAGGFGLGFRTEQLNCSEDYGSGPTNEIQALSAAGYFSAPVTNDVHNLLALATATNTAYSLEFRSRSFLMANCSQCHQPGGSVQNATWDANINTPTALAGLINGALANDLGNSGNHVISPLSPSNSVLLARIAARGPNSIQMPPLDSALVDGDATNAITQWILSLTNSFWLGALPDPQTVIAGNNAVYGVTFVATSDFTSDVALSVSGLPSGASAGFSPATVNGATTNSTLTITTSGATPNGTYTLRITGIGGGVTNVETFGLTVVSSIVAPGTLLWSGGSGVDTSWSDALNWTNTTAGGYGPPGPQNDVKFDNTAAVSSSATANNFADGGFTIRSLQYANYATTPNYHVTQIASGASLFVTNGLTVGTGSNPGGDTVVSAVIKGVGGALTVSGGDISVGQGSASDGIHQATLDLSGLGMFSASVSKFAVGVYGYPPPSDSATPRASGVIYLARTNVITTSSLGETNGVLVSWNANSGGGADFANQPSKLFLGQSNVFYTDAVTVGAVKARSGALLAFNPAGLNSPAAYFRGVGGFNSRVSIWGIGDDFTQPASNQNTYGTNDFTGGTVDALVDRMRIGASCNGNNTGSGTGVLKFNAGIFDVNALTNGWQTASSGATGTGTITINGAATLKVNNILVLGQFTGGAGGASGTLNVTGGQVLANRIIVGGGTGAITLNNATLVATNNVGTPVNPINTFTTIGSTLHLRLNGSAIGTNICVATLNASGASTITIDGIVNVSGVTTFPLISYTGSAPAAGNFVNGALPSGFSGNLVNNTAQKRIDLVVAPNAAVTPRINAINLTGMNLVIGGTNGFPGGLYYVLASTNVALPRNQWLPISTNPFDANGNFNFTNLLNPAAPQIFYLLQLP